MSTRSAARQEFESHPVPSLEIVARLEPVADGDVAALPTPPSITLRGGRGLRNGLIALLAAVAVATAVFLITHRTHHVGGRAASVPTTRQREQTSFRLALAGVHAASSTMLSAAAAQSGRTLTATRATPVPHDLSATDLTSLAAGTSLYQPPRYLANAYRNVAARFHIPWRVLASVEYLQGTYVDATAGADAGAERTVSGQVQSNGRDVVDEHVLAQATTAALQPSASLVNDAKHLAADGVTQSPAAGLNTYLKPVATTPQTVMTLAQSIAPAATPSSTAPMAKVNAMLNEARLLDGLPYAWGGGHTDPAWVVSSGYDCSGFVSEVLHAAGYLNSPDTTQTLPGSAGIVNGPGKLVTIYDRTIATLRVWRKHRTIVTEKKVINQASAGVHVVKGRHANSLTSVSIKLPKWVGEWKTIKVKKLVRSQDTTNNDEHVIIDIDGQWWESGGSTADGGAAMVHEIVSPSKAYLKSFNRILHPQGL
jgi:cell wall-associated NlpC family hydrolase